MNIFDWYVHSYNTLHINWDTLTNISVILFARFVPILIGSLKCMCVCVCVFVAFVIIFEWEVDKFVPIQRGFSQPNRSIQLPFSLQN